MKPACLFKSLSNGAKLMSDGEWIDLPHFEIVFKVIIHGHETCVLLEHTPIWGTWIVSRNW